VIKDRVFVFVNIYQHSEKRTHCGEFVCGTKQNGCVLVWFTAVRRGVCRADFFHSKPKLYDPQNNYDFPHFERTIPRDTTMIDKRVFLSVILI